MERNLLNVVRKEDFDIINIHLNNQGNRFFGPDIFIQFLKNLIFPTAKSGVVNISKTNRSGPKIISAIDLSGLFESI